MNKKIESGFTLIELVICLSMVSIIIFYSAPLVSEVYQRNKVEMIVDDVITAVHFARNLAFNNDTPVKLRALSGTDDWSEGMVIVLNRGQQEKIIRQWAWHNKYVHVYWNGFRSHQYVLFSNHLRQSTANGHFLINHEKHPSRTLIVNRLGHIREEKSGISP